MHSGSNETISNVAVVDLLPGSQNWNRTPRPRRRRPATQTNSPPTRRRTFRKKACPTQDEASADDADKLSAWQPESTNHHEDRIILYGVFAPNEEAYHYRIKATARGTFVVPPPYAESMYDPALKVRGVAGSIEVQ